MKQWWQNLTLRERLIVGVGGVLAVLIIFYVFFWQPLSDDVSNLQQQLTSKQNNVRWIASASARIQALQTSGFRVSLGHTPVLKVVNQTLSSAKLNYYLKQAPLPQGHNVQVVLVNAPFDAMMSWLRRMWLQQGIVVQHIKVVRTTTLGTINAEVLLGRSTTTAS